MKSPMLDIRKDGTLVFQEMFSGVIDCAKSNEPVPICDFEYIDDVYERIMEYEQEGKFIYEKFEALPQYRHDIIRGIIFKNIKRGMLLANPDIPEARFIQDKYTQYWKEADVLSEHGLL